MIYLWGSRSRSNVLGHNEQHTEWLSNATDLGQHQRLKRRRRWDSATIFNCATPHFVDLWILWFVDFCIIGKLYFIRGNVGGRFYFGFGGSKYIFDPCSHIELNTQNPNPTLKTAICFTKTPHTPKYFRSFGKNGKIYINKKTMFNFVLCISSIIQLLYVL